MPISLLEDIVEKGLFLEKSYLFLDMTSFYQINISRSLPFSIYLYFSKLVMKRRRILCEREIRLVYFKTNFSTV